MGDRGSKQGHNAIAHDLVHGPFVTVHRRHHALQHRVEELASLLGVAVGQQLHRALEIGKQHRDLLALALEGCAGGNDLLGQAAGGVIERWLGIRGERSWCLPDEGSPAFTTELGPWEIVSPATGTAGPESSTTVNAELPPIRIIRATARAAHGCALLRERASNQEARRQEPRRALEM
jgi:hypothetical protein